MWFGQEKKYYLTKKPSHFLVLTSDIDIFL